MGAGQIIEQVLANIGMMTWLYIFAGCFIGIIVGALPGLTTTMGIALLTGITYHMSGSSAVALLIGLYVGGTYGGSLSAILLNIPGTPAAAATALDGNPLARKGHAAEAIIVTRVASIIGTIFGMICLLAFTPLLNKITLNFTSPEFFLLGLFGILISGTLTGGDLSLKGWLAGIFGIAIAMIGNDDMYSYPRFTFGSVQLMTGVPFIPIMIGFFGVPQIIDALKSQQDIIVASIQKASFSFKTVFKNLWWTIRAGLIGVGIGVIPGVGEDVAAWVAYGAAKKASKHPEEFGKGSFEGLVACETSNNACVGGALIPLLSLGIPGSPPAAVLLGALMLHNVRPGPMLEFENPSFIYQITAFLAIGSVCLLVLGTLLAKPVSKILQVSPKIIMPLVAVLCAIGAYALDLRIFNIILVFIAGLVGYIFQSAKYPAAPLVLGMILGTLTDTSLRRALQASRGDLTVFVTRPIALVFLVAIVLLIASQVGLISKLRALFAKRSGKQKA